VRDLSERLRDAEDATKRALFDAFDPRLVYDKTGDHLSVSGTLTGAFTAALRSFVRIVTTPGVGLEPTTSRLTVERICQIELPRIGLPLIRVGRGRILREPNPSRPG
jgi:hypothetical protein